MREASGAVRLLILAWLAASAILTVTQFRYTVGLRNDVPYLVVAGGASVAAWLGAVRLRGRQRLIGALFAASIATSSLGDFISLAIGWRVGAEPEASVADLAWLTSYLALGAGLLLLLRGGERGQRRDIDGLIDVGAVFVAGMMVIWELAVAATLTDQSLPVGIRVLWGLYPVLDLAVLALALRVLMRHRTLTALLIAVGVALWLAADVAYLAIADPAFYHVVLDAGWLWGMILIALAVLHGPSARTRLWGVRPEPAIDDVGLGRISVALLPLLVPALIVLNGYLRGQETNPVVTTAGTVVLVVLAFLRMARLAWSARWAREALVSQERYASALAANSADAVVVVDPDLNLVDNFPRLAALTGLAGRDIRGLNLSRLVDSADLAQARTAARRCLANPGQVFYAEFRIVHDASRRKWLAARMVNLLTDPDVRGVVVNLHDISDRKRAEEELAHQAFHDALTGLANRALFRDRMDHALDRDSPTGTGPAVIFLDLDGFKFVNDSLGHDVGDDLLREVAARLVGAVRRGDTVGRLGGDEFAILIEQSPRPLDEATAVAERVLRALRDPVRLGQHTVTVSASLGIAVGGGPGDPAGLLRDADVAMYQSKATGRNKWTAYQPGMRTAALERIELENDLHLAVARDEFRLDYQPVIELATGRVIGFEALLRWEHPKYGRLSPDRFIPLTEETGLIVPIGRWVLRQATRTAAHWQHRLHRGSDLTMAVNISARQLTAPDLVDDVTDALATSGLDPTGLVLEMTETVLVQDAAATATRLKELRHLGVRLAIDDFGTGYSSLSYLRQFPVDILKIDRTFIHTIPEHGQIPAILRGLLELGRTLQLQTVAEGVERDFQRARLREEHCDLAQGYLFARPMPAAEVEQVFDETDATRVTGAVGSASE